MNGKVCEWSTWKTIDVRIISYIALTVTFYNLTEEQAHEFQPNTQINTEIFLLIHLHYINWLTHHLQTLIQLLHTNMILNNIDIEIDQDAKYARFVDVKCVKSSKYVLGDEDDVWYGLTTVTIGVWNRFEISWLKKVL